MNKSNLNILSVYADAVYFFFITQAMDAGSVALPISVQVATPTFRDELCLRVMKEIEGLNTDWEVVYLGAERFLETGFLIVSLNEKRINDETMGYNRNEENLQVTQKFPEK